MKKKNYLIISGIIFIVIIIGFIIWYSISVESKNFIKLNYSEVLEKVDNKESFILCVSASECIHCNSYKPKLKKISNDYNIKIYYTEFKDKFSFDGGTPTTIFFKDGEEKTTATRIEGDISVERTIDKFKKNGFIK